MTTRESVLFMALAIVLGAMTGMGYVIASRPSALQAYYSGEPVNAGYVVGPGTPEVQVQAATPPPIPTSEWLQPGRDIDCDMAAAIAGDAASHTCEALWERERADPHVKRGLQIEPGNQVTRIHTFGRYSYMLFTQALIVWRNEGDDGRIAVLSPHGCWRALPDATR